MSHDVIARGMVRNTLEKTELAIKNGQSRDTGNTGQTKNRLKTAKKKIKQNNTKTTTKKQKPYRY
jgi:hypothetical protein